MATTGIYLSVMKSAYISRIIGPRGLVCEANLLEIIDWESFDVRFHLGPLLQGQTSIAKLKSAYNSLIIGLRGWDGNQPIGNDGLGIFWCGPIRPWASSRSKDDTQT